MSRKLLFCIVGVLGALVLAGIVVIILGGASEEPPPAATSATTASGDLHVTSQIDSSRVGKDASVEFWLQIENTGKSAITGLTLEPLDAPGFSPDGCDCQAPGSSCPVNETAPAAANPNPTPSANPAAPPPTSAFNSSGASISPTCSLLADSLAPGQKIAVWVHLRSEEVHNSEILSAGLAWKDAAGHTSSIAAPVGPISIRSRLEKWIEARAALLQSLALPLAIFILGGIFSVAKYFSDRADKEADDKRASKAQAANDRREQLTQTWNRMLPASHRLALRYYVPMSAAVYETLYWLHEADPANATATATPAAPVDKSGSPAPAATTTDASKPPQWDEAKLKRAFYGLMLFEKRVRNTTVRAGGFYFKDRTGEKIVQRCYLRYRQSFYRKYSAEQEAVEKVRDLCTVNMDLKDFNAEWAASQTEFNAVWEKFKEWTTKSDGYPQAGKILTAFRAILDYEANRPYEYWYGKRDPLYIEAEAEKMLRGGDWSGLTDPVEAKAFQDAVVAYLNENKKQPPADPAAAAENARATAAQPAP